MALPNTNISTTLVGDTIGSGSRDVGTLCTHPNINKWSRWKPIRMNTAQPITGPQIMSANCGLDILEFSTLNDLITHYRSFDNNDYKFEYLRPRGGSVTPAEPYRLGDFRNYDHQAFKWYYTTGFNQYYYASEPFNEFRLSRYADTSIEWSTLGLTFHSFGLVFVSAGTLDNQKVKLNHTTLYEAGGTFVDMDLSDLPVGDYDIFAFVFYRSNDVIQHYVPIENGFLGTASLKANTVEVTLTGSMTGSPINRKVSYNLTLSNYKSTPQILEGCKMDIRYSSSDPSSSLRPGEASISLGTIEIPANNTYNVSDEVSGVLTGVPTIETSGYLYFSNTTDPSLNTTRHLRAPAQ